MLYDELNFDAAIIQIIDDEIFNSKNVKLDVLRLDKIHPVVSGNKWFKLKYFLQQAIKNKFSTVATFGGAFSNHILATAYACNKNNLQSIGFIRGEEPKQYSQTLINAKALNMQLEFVNREAFKQKEIIINANPDLFFIPEGGYGATGAKGTAEILQLVPNLSKYNYIICAVGTGTMLSGLVNASLPMQQCIGISVLKNNFSVENETAMLIKNDTLNQFKILYDYSFGGYAKHTQQLINFMNNVYAKHILPLDFVYTAKALFGTYDLATKNFFTPGANILFIHSGGLQGNSSLGEKLRYNL